MVATKEDYCPHCDRETKIVKTVPHQDNRCMECGSAVTE